ncbi:MAG TPA: hypothetical protein VM864_13300 [Pyrinomonadaceae bacterium]|nr:hypothetical protein [Pyrinomonadaceae bacterium]
MKKFLLAVVLAAASAVAAGSVASTAQEAQQQPAPAGDKDIKATSVLGDVTAINVEANGLAVKTAAGSSVLVMLTPKTAFKRAQPGAATLDGASDIKLADIALGDRVFAYGRVASDHKTVPAQLVVVMTKSDIAKKQEHDKAEWSRRGIWGTVMSVNAATKEITINSRSPAGLKPVIVEASGQRVAFLRYAPDSVQYADAKPSSFTELKVGDQLRALGERTPDGARYKPEEIVSGSFKTILGTVASIDAAAGTVKITPNGQKQPLTVAVTSSSNLRRIDPMMGQMLAFMVMRQAGGGFGAGAGQGNVRIGGPGGGGGQPPAGAPPQGGGEGPGGQRRMTMGGGGNFDIQELIDRQPQATLANLKAGDVVIVSSAAGSDATRLTAITLLAGAEPVLVALQTRPAGGAAAGAVTSSGLPAGIDLGIGLP